MITISTQTKRNLTSIIKQMNHSIEDFVKNPGKDFSRNRKLSFETVITLLLSMNGNNLSKELLDYFNYDLKTASSSAFIQQRAKIAPNALDYLFKTFTASYKNHKTFLGYRLLAADGSTLNIAHNPTDVDSYIKSSEHARGYNLLHLNTLYDLSNKLYLDAQIQPIRKQNETGALIEMVDRSPLSDDVILIADRGYESYNVFAHIEEKGWKYLIRVKDNSRRSIVSTLNLPPTDEFDETFQLTLTRKQTKEIKANPKKYKFLPKNARFDYFELTNRLFYDLSFRVVRFKITENTYETIITNLDQGAFSPERLKEMYHMRWGIETSFRELKYAIGLVNFHSKKMEYIVQEIFAKLTMYNFCEMITLNVMISENKRKHKYQVNFTAAIHICRHYFRCRENETPPDVERLIQQYILPIREGRQDKRKIRYKSTVPFNYRVS